MDWAAAGFCAAPIDPGNLDLQMAKVSPFKFLQEVRQEAAKITWPTRRETAITTVMVFVMSVLAAMFFLVADQLIRIVVTFVLRVAS
jgi:preprotein translocase subunit SecE